MIDRLARNRVIDAIESFLDDRIMAFEFDDCLQEIETADETVGMVINAAWYHYDDIRDHEVCLSKVEWDYFQRLLLILRSDAEFPDVREKGWRWDYAMAVLALVFIAGMVFGASWVWYHFALTALCGVLAITISSHRDQQMRSSAYEAGCFPFDSFSLIRELLRQTPGFQKRKYRPELRARIRSMA